MPEPSLSAPRLHQSGPASVKFARDAPPAGTAAYPLIASVPDGESSRTTGARCGRSESGAAPIRRKRATSFADETARVQATEIAVRYRPLLFAALERDSRLCARSSSVPSGNGRCGRPSTTCRVHLGHECWRSFRALVTSDGPVLSFPTPPTVTKRRQCCHSAWTR